MTMSNEDKLLVEKATKILDDAKFKMALGGQVFVITVGLSLNWKIELGMQGIAATDGVNVYWNPEVLVQIPPEDVMFIMYHEIWHVCFDHMARIEDTSIDKEKWNRAADYVINAQLIEKSHLKMPKGDFAGLYDKKYSGMSTHEIYDLLPDTPKNPDGSPQSQPGDMGDLRPVPGDSVAEKAENAQNIKETIVAAATAAQLESDDSYGQLPGDIQKLVDELTNPMLPWTTILQNYMSAYAKQDFSWKRPNKRFAPDFYLPSLYSESCGEIAVAIDTSGSVSREEFTAFIAEVDSMQDLNPSKLTVIPFDTRIQDVYELTEDKSITDIEFKGGGGTALEPVFDMYKKNHPQVLIVFSDLYCREIPEHPGYDVIWIVVNNENAHTNFGEMIHIQT